MNMRRALLLSVFLPLLSLSCSSDLIKGQRSTGKGLGPGKSGPDFSLTINAKANIFRAGSGSADENGGGEPAPSVTFSAGAGNVLTVSKVIGTVSCCGNGEDFNDADGGTFAGGVTDVESAGGISGITHPNKTMFLVGVFTDDSSAQPPGPPRLDATSGANLTPRLFQTFFIGTGKGREIQVPPSATRLYLGFADASAFTGLPGSYDDNVGELKANFRISPGSK
jgi:hypothetical protein